ncbi:sensor histidine kinase [Plebeiibacterium marinum]|uniref:histidine kinase n=1 Tax=Plebeiibacterium marinum TaxID=2992111 RepID=A0AAE3SIB5_9BACT|nr:ATP-binding protein [Plebeiobacterium marinum]MCW3804219.1 ATP-binding protein [Plebeiobacterium marinum]
MKNSNVDIKQYKQLLEQVEYLEQENNFLANRAEEILLLSLLSETVATIDDETVILEELLEKISILRNISFCSCYAKTQVSYRIVSGYFEGEISKVHQLDITLCEDVERELIDYHVYCKAAKDCKGEFLEKLPLKVFENAMVLIIPFESAWVKRGVFIFVSNSPDQNIKESILIIQQAIRIILDKIDKIIYIRKIEQLNQSLETKVEQRTMELSDINTKLIEEINERHAIEIELRKARDKAMESDRLKSAFLANMSHEIRTPMNAIVGFSELLANHMCDEGDVEMYARLIHSNSLSLLNLINDLLDFSKIEANQLVIRKRMCSINTVLSEIKALGDSLIMQFEKHNLVLEVDQCTDKGDVKVFTDDLRLKQILLNLVSNAIKFSFEGVVKIRHCLKDHFCHFEVVDNGIGISKEQHNVIFNRFTRVYNSINKPILGNGLGLTITKNLVEMLGGEITVESVLGQGATFRFYIDVSESPEENETDI